MGNKKLECCFVSRLCRHWWVSMQGLLAVNPLGFSYALPPTNPILTKPDYLGELLPRNWSVVPTKRRRFDTISIFTLHSMSITPYLSTFKLLLALWSELTARSSSRISFRERLVSRCRFYTTTSCN